MGCDVNDDECMMNELRMNFKTGAGFDPTWTAMPMMTNDVCNIVRLLFPELRT